MKKKVLIIAYYWPPAGGPGVQRWLKFVKYLPEFGIEPIVYVPQNPRYPIIDNTLLAEVPEGVTVIKKPIREPYGWASLLLKKQTKTISSGILPKDKKQGLIQKAMLYIRGNFFVPDARVGWVEPSIHFLKTWIEELAITTVITTGPPHSMHLIGKGLKAGNPSLRWFTDFRDPWTTISYHDKLRMTPKTKARHKQLESDVLNSADQIIVTSPSTKKEFEQLTKQPICVITNGFDDRDKSISLPSKRFVLSHIGSLLSERNPLILWEVLRELCDEDATFSNTLSLQLVGKVSTAVVDAIKKNGLESHLDLVGYVSHKEAQCIQDQASGLLLIEINAIITKGIIAGKLFEYLSSGRPIIALGPSGSDIEAIIKETGTGIFVDYSEKYVLKKNIRALFDTKEINTPNEKAISNYHRKALTEQLAQLL